MGYSSWSYDFYVDREQERAKTGRTVFTYHTDVSMGRAARQVHAKMDPKKATRESRDSDEHPDSVAIAVLLDVTGSMAQTPVMMQKALPQLMDEITASGVEHPQILFGAIGDYFSDRASSQIGQFESGIEMEDDLGRLYLEGGGGGTMEESYQNALYFMARHTLIDCHEKRGQRGYLFLVGDEMPYPKATKKEIQEIFGDDVQADIPIEQLVREAQDKYEVFFIIPMGASHANSPVIRSRWVELLGETHVLSCEPSSICQTITAAISNPAQAEAHPLGTTRL